MKRVAHDACSRHFSCRAVAGDAVRFRWHKNIGSVAAVHRVMTVIALHAGVLGVIEIRLRHPTIDKDRFCNYRRRIRHGLHLVTERAAVK